MVVLDNASIHHVKEVEDLIISTGALIRYLPPYSPQLNSIEEAFSKVKQYLRDNEIPFQSTNEPRLLVASAFASITSKDCIGYVRHSGYDITF